MPSYLPAFVSSIKFLVVYYDRFTRPVSQTQDGTTMQIARLPDIDEGTWAEVKAYVESRWA